MKFNKIDTITPFIGVLLLLFLWQRIATSGWVNPILLPTPIATLQTLTQIFLQPEKSLAVDLLATLRRTLQSFAIAASLGIPIGVLLGSSTRLYRSVEFAIDFCRSLPASTLIPLFLLFLGLNEANKIVAAAFSASLTIVFNSAYGVMNASKSRILAAKVMGANRWQIFKDVLLWESLPQTFVGLRSGISLALVYVIVAEMLAGADVGLGKRILDAQQVLNVKDMYASILMTGVLGYGLNLFFLVWQKRWVHWSGK